MDVFNDLIWGFKFWWIYDEFCWLVSVGNFGMLVFDVSKNSNNRYYSRDSYIWGRWDRYIWGRSLEELIFWLDFFIDGWYS